MKRLLDVVLASMGAVAVAPALTAAATAVWLTDGTPVLFRQERLGRGRRPFSLVKLRTMRDGQVTPLGRWLRELGIDELPQLVHVLRGEMSLVGPRPLTEADVQRLGWQGRRYDARWSVKPGLTGPGQLRLAGPCDRRVTWLYDRHYAEHHGTKQDLAILCASLLVGALGKARTRRVFGRWGVEG